jgi:uncharacterized protein (TIGR02996 family)
MSTEAAFLEQLAREPGDDVTRLVYADWLEEHGDRRGDYLRKEVELATVAEHDPRHDPLEQELRQLREGITEEWLERACKRFDVVLFGYEPRAKIAAIKRLRELAPCGLMEAKHLVETLSACLQANLPRHRAELFRDGMRAPLDRLDVEIMPTAFASAGYATLLSSDSVWGPTEAARQQAEAMRVRCYARLVDLLSFDPRLSGERPGSKPVPLQQGVPFAVAEAVRQAGLPAIRIMLRRLPAADDVPQGFVLDWGDMRRYDVVLDRFAETDEPFVAWTVSALAGCSREEAHERIRNLPLTVRREVEMADAVWTFRRFRGRAEVRIVRCP